jgi:hypothetical protein
MPDTKLDSDATLTSALLAHAQRFLPCRLRETSVTLPEKESLAAAGVNDRTEQMYLAWRRTTLFAVAAVSLFAALLSAAVTLLEAEMFAPNLGGVLMKLTRTMSLFALPAGAIAAAVLWTNLAWSRWLLIGGWLIATLTPLVIGLMPFPYLTSADMPEFDISGRFCGMIHFFRVLAICLSFTPGVLRAGLWLKSLRPASAVGPWSVAAAAGVHVVVYWIVFLVLSQMCGNGWLFGAALFLIGGPLVYLIGYRWLLAPAGPATYRNLLIARGSHLLVAGFGLGLLGLFVVTKTFDPHGDLRLFGLHVDHALIRPGSMLQMVVDFVSRTFATSVIALDLFEQLHRAVTPVPSEPPAFSEPT